MADERGDRSTVQKYLEVASVLVCPLTSNVDVTRSGIADRDGRHGFQDIADRASTAILNFFLRNNDDFFGFPKTLDFDVVRTDVCGLQFNGIVVFAVMGGVLASCAYTAMAVRKAAEKTANLNTVPVEKYCAISFEFIFVLYIAPKRAILAVMRMIRILKVLYIYLQVRHFA